MCAFDDPWEWELVDVEAICESHSLFMEDEHTSIWQPKCDNDAIDARQFYLAPWVGEIKYKIS